MTRSRESHWDDVYRRRTAEELSWHQDEPAISLSLAERAGLTPATVAIDVGGGASGFAKGLLDRGLRDVSVLDLSAAALNVLAERLGPQAASIRQICADITQWTPLRSFDLWHDRAVFHFLVEPADRAAYLANLARALSPGGHAIIATFAPDGPEKCSGLPVMRYAPQDLANVLGEGFELLEHRLQVHLTPAGATQSFQFSLFRKTP